MVETLIISLEIGTRFIYYGNIFDNLEKRYLMSYKFDTLNITSSIVFILLKKFGIHVRFMTSFFHLQTWVLRSSDQEEYWHDGEGATSDATIAVPTWEAKIHKKKSPIQKVYDECSFRLICLGLGEGSTHGCLGILFSLVNSRLGVFSYWCVRVIRNGVWRCAGFLGFWRNRTCHVL